MLRWYRTLTSKVFKCLKCGECCKASPISILPHELAILKRLAERHRVRLEVGFDYTVYDEISGYKIVLTYYIRPREDGSCPFLTEDNLCMVHREYKPLICRSFPYVPSQVKYFFDPATKTIFHKTSFALSSACPILKRVKKVKGEADGREVSKFLVRELRAAREFDFERAKYMAALSYLWRVGLVKLVFNFKGRAVPVNAYLFIRQYLPTFTPAG